MGLRERDIHVRCAGELYHGVNLLLTLVTLKEELCSSRSKNKNKIQLEKFKS